MTKVELIASVAAEAGMSKKDAEKAVNAALAAITEELKNGGKVSLVGFGTFEVRERPERQGRNPQTKEPMTIAASKLPAFKAGPRRNQSFRRSRWIRVPAAFECCGCTWAAGHR